MQFRCRPAESLRGSALTRSPTEKTVSASLPSRSCSARQTEACDVWIRTARSRNRTVGIRVQGDIGKPVAGGTKPLPFSAACADANSVVVRGRDEFLSLFVRSGFGFRFFLQ